MKKGEVPSLPNLHFSNSNDKVHWKTKSPDPNTTKKKPPWFLDTLWSSKFTLFISLQMNTSRQSFFPERTQGRLDRLLATFQTCRASTWCRSSGRSPAFRSWTSPPPTCRRSVWSTCWPGSPDFVSSAPASWTASTTAWWRPGPRSATRATW